MCLILLASAALSFSCLKSQAFWEMPRGKKTQRHVQTDDWTRETSERIDQEHLEMPRQYAVPEHVWERHVRQNAGASSASSSSAPAAGSYERAASRSGLDVHRLANASYSGFEPMRNTFFVKGRPVQADGAA